MQEISKPVERLLASVGLCCKKFVEVKQWISIEMATVKKFTV